MADNLVGSNGCWEIAQMSTGVVLVFRIPLFLQSLPPSPPAPHGLASAPTRLPYSLHPRVLLTPEHTHHSRPSVSPS